MNEINERKNVVWKNNTRIKGSYEKKFYRNTVCERCGNNLNGRRCMSLFENKCICEKCKAEERKNENFLNASKKHLEEMKKLNIK